MSDDDTIELELDTKPALPRILPHAFKGEVIADSSGKWCGNALTFATEAEARAYILDLSMRWTSVRETRVITCQDSVTYRWDNLEGPVRLDNPILVGPGFLASRIRLDTPPETPIAKRVMAQAVLPEADLTRSQSAVVSRLFNTLALWSTDVATQREAAEAQRLAVAAEIAEDMARKEEQAETSRRAWQANHDAQMRAIQGKAVPSTAQQTEQTIQAVRTHDVVIGAETEGSGVITGWVGSGEMSLPQIQKALRTAGLPDVWAPEPKSALAHAGSALQQLNLMGTFVRSAKRGQKRGDRAQDLNGIVRRFAGRWIVAKANAMDGEVGDQAGSIVMTATLYVDGRLECEGQVDLCDRVSADYQRRADAEVYSAAEITMWLRGLLLRRFRAVRLGGVWFVPKTYTNETQRLVDSLSKAWGSDWVNPPLPMATTAQLLRGLTTGLVKESLDVLSDLGTQRELAHKSGQTDIRPGAAATLHKRLMVVAERARGYAALLGDSHVAEIRTALQAALETVRPLCDDISVRFSQLEL